MNFFDGILVVLVPFLAILLPGAFFVRTPSWNSLLISGSRILLWSLSILTLTLTLGLYFGIPVQSVALLVATVSLVYAILYKREFFSRERLWHLLAILIPILIATSAFTIPFLFIHDGLPTGDIQKSIIWANESVVSNSLPNYERAVLFLNRDPVDFYTPGLHAISALILSLSPAPLTSVSIFAIVVAVCVGWITASITRELFDNHDHFVSPLLSAIFLLTQFRFLRYLREPGYHFQNVFGEIFLFGILLLCIRFIKQREKQDAVLIIVSAVALLLTHQFSAFIAVFVCASMALGSVFVFRNKIIHAVRDHQSVALLFTVVALSSIFLLFSLGLQSKIPSIFTTTPHLQSLVLPLVSYPATMGEFWLLSGIAGLALLCVGMKRKNAHAKQVTLFVCATIAITLLSQGPNIGIDIPPVRALFYLAVPLSVSAAYLFGKLMSQSSAKYKLVCCVAIIAAMWGTTQKSYASISHQVRTNSSLTAEQLGLIEILRNSDRGGILIDDYSRKSASWLVLADIPMFTRIGADLERQMEESGQSALRNELYLNQLDYEKIIELGSLPEISTLLTRNAIKYVTGIAGSSYDAFANNQQLREIATAADITIFQTVPTTNTCADVECEFLLRSSTLANDIGDNLDTFEYLQASIRSPQVSEAKTQGSTTYREITSPIIPLSFNVGDYVRVLWDPANTGKPQGMLTFMLQLTKPVQGLSLQTSSGHELALPYKKNIFVELPADSVEFTEKGFVTLTLQNPQANVVPIDVLALGITPL